MANSGWLAGGKSRMASAGEAAAAGAIAGAAASSASAATNATFTGPPVSLRQARPDSPKSRRNLYEACGWEEGDSPGEGRRILGSGGPVACPHGAMSNV